MQVKLEVDFSVRFKRRNFLVSLKFEERSEETAKFPSVQTNFFTSCARWHNNSESKNTCFRFYPKNFPSNLPKRRHYFFFTSVGLVLTY